MSCSARFFNVLSSSPLSYIIFNVLTDPNGLPPLKKCTVYDSVLDPGTNEPSVDHSVTNQLPTSQEDDNGQPPPPPPPPPEGEAVEHVDTSGTGRKKIVENFSECLMISHCVL